MLKKVRPAPWNKGCSKETHPSVLKISRTLASKKYSNFYFWQQQRGRRKYPPFDQSESLAELIGVVLGDGHIESFPRTERIIISCNSKNKGFIKRYENLISNIFKKKPSLIKSKDINCTRISLYEKRISERLKIPAGNRAGLKMEIPPWILKKMPLLIAYLRGLYEAEGSLCIHEATYTYKFLFSNKNLSLQNNVFRGLKILGFHPHKGRFQIQLSKKEEVLRAIELLKFRSY